MCINTHKIRSTTQRILFNGFILHLATLFHGVVQTFFFIFCIVSLSLLYICIMFVNINFFFFFARVWILPQTVNWNKVSCIILYHRIYFLLSFASWNFSWTFSFFHSFIHSVIYYLLAWYSTSQIKLFFLCKNLLIKSFFLILQFYYTKEILFDKVEKYL